MVSSFLKLNLFDYVFSKNYLTCIVTEIISPNRTIKNNIRVRGSWNEWPSVFPNKEKLLLKDLPEILLICIVIENISPNMTTENNNRAKRSWNGWSRVFLFGTMDEIYIIFDKKSIQGNTKMKINVNDQDSTYQ